MELSNYYEQLVFGSINKPSLKDVDGSGETYIETEKKIMPESHSAYLYEDIKSLRDNMSEQGANKIIIKDAFHERPDARCLRIKNTGFIGVDFRIYQLVFNFIVHLHSQKGFKLPGVEENKYGSDKNDYTDLLEEILNAANGHIETTDESRIPTKSMQQIAMVIVTLAEEFIVCHELGHIDLSNLTNEINGTSFKICSIISGLSLDTELGNANVGLDIVAHSWLSELLADRYASKLLQSRIANLLGEFQPHIYYFVLCFLFHLIEIYQKAQWFSVKDFNILKCHPPAFYRLSFCDVPYECYEPHVKYFGDDPFKSIAYMFDQLNNCLNIYKCLNNEEQELLEYSSWCLNKTNEIDKWLKEKIEKIEVPYYKKGIK